MYLGLEDKGSVFSILKNWPERRVKAICLTDGQRVGNLGDLGVQVSTVIVGTAACTARLCCMYCCCMYCCCCCCCCCCCRGW